MSEAFPIPGRIKAATSFEPQAKTLVLRWDELLRHLTLKELLRVEGVNMAGQAFWLILQPSTIHAVHLLAYGYLGILERAQPGSPGILSIKPGEWGEIRIDRRQDGIARFTANTMPTEPEWGSGVEMGIGLGNMVDYVRGNALVIKATAGQFQYRHIKEWDIPVEFALNAGRANTSEHAESASYSGATGSPADAGTEPEAIQRLTSGKVHLLKREGRSVLDLRVEGPIAVRLFVPNPSSAEKTLEADSVTQIARRDCLMHLRLRPVSQSADGLAEGLWVVYRDAATHNLRTENLLERNVVGVARFGEARLVDVVRLSARRLTDETGGPTVVRLVNLAEDLNVVLAVWMSDPLLPSLTAGRKVGGNRYTLIRALGAGGMGVVWLAEDEHLNERVALKFLPPEIRADLAALEDLRRETLKSRKLSHPNIIRIHDLHQTEGEPPFISMEYVDGFNLMALRAEQPQNVLSWSHLEPLLKQLCEALDYAHREGVIHRDLKPSNLMLDRQGRLKLADFGIAAVVNDSVSRLADRQISGTPAYMSPQQWQGKPAWITDDIYALGSTLYELLTSRPPFFTGDIAHQALHVTPSPLEQRLTELGVTNKIPSDVAALIMACLAKESDRRPHSARAVAEWIRFEIPETPSAPNFGGSSVVATQSKRSALAFAAGLRAWWCGWLRSARRWMGRRPH